MLVAAVADHPFTATATEPTAAAGGNGTKKQQMPKTIATARAAAATN